jgi:hypothetical protein
MAPHEVYQGHLWPLVDCWPLPHGESSTLASMTLSLRVYGATAGMLVIAMREIHLSLNHRVDAITGVDAGRVRCWIIPAHLGAHRGLLTAALPMHSSDTIGLIELKDFAQSPGTLNTWFNASGPVYDILTYTDGSCTMKAFKRTAVCNSYDLEMMARSYLYSISWLLMSSLRAKESAPALNLLTVCYNSRHLSSMSLSTSTSSRLPMQGSTSPLNDSHR